MLTGVLLDTVNHEFSLDQNYGAGVTQGESLSYNDETPSGDYSVAFHIINMGTAPINEASTTPQVAVCRSCPPLHAFATANTTATTMRSQQLFSASQPVPSSSPVKPVPTALKPSIPPTLHPGFGYPGRQITKPPPVDDCCFLTGK